MSTILKSFGTSNIVTILSIVFACGLGWGKIEKTIEEFKIIRNGDIHRIEKVEISQENLKDKFHSLEKNQIQISTDIKYIVLSIDEVKKLLQNKNIASSK
jgi:hypothetical protein